MLKGNKLIATNCENSHARSALVCKMAAEFEVFKQNPAK